VPWIGRGIFFVSVALCVTALIGFSTMARDVPAKPVQAAPRKRKVLQAA
jgi:hypothetical protein